MRTRPSRCWPAPDATAASSATEVSKIIENDLRELVEEAFARRRHEFSARRSVLYIRTLSGREVVVVLEAARHLSDTDRALVEIFCSRLSIAFDNVILYEQLQDANARLEERVAQRTRDLTAANRRLAAQWARLRHANAFKSEILGTVAHDLKNPLGVILGRTEMLKEMIAAAGAPDENMLAQIDHVRNAANRLTEMVDDLSPTPWPTRSTSRSGASRSISPPSCRRWRTPTGRSPTASNRPSRSPPRPITSPAATPTASARPSTTWSATPSNTARSAATIDLLVGRTADGISVEVRDQGAGLSPEDISRLFGRFQRLSAKPTAGETSTGLGLSIVKRIVELHGGADHGRKRGSRAGRDVQDDVAGDMSQTQPHIIVVDDEAARPRDGRRLSAHARLQRHARATAAPACARPSPGRCRT